MAFVLPLVAVSMCLLLTGGPPPVAATAAKELLIDDDDGRGGVSLGLHGTEVRRRDLLWISDEQRNHNVIRLWVLTFLVAYQIVDAPKL